MVHSFFCCSDSVSPAFLIRVGATLSYSGSQEESEEEKHENIYEEIRDKSTDQEPIETYGQSYSSSQKTSNSSTQTTKSKFQKALEAVTRKSSNSKALESGQTEKSFHLSISKGRKKSLIDKARVDWDCEAGRLGGKLARSSSDMLGAVNASHDKVMSQLKLDVEVRIAV